MYLSDQQIKEIAQNVSTDFFTTYVHKTKAEFTCLMYHEEMEDEEDLAGIIGEEEAKQVMKEVKLIEDNREDYILIQKIDSSESYRFMKDFIYLLNNSKAKTDLFHAIEKRGPFRQFKDTLFDYPEIEQEWYRYRDFRMEEYVKKMIHFEVNDGIDYKGGSFELQLYKNAAEAASSKINYHNKQFRVVASSTNGAVSSETIFTYQQVNNVLTAHYEGGEIITGHLIGLVDANGNIDMRYHQINKAGELMTGKCSSQPELLKNGTIRLHESWEWTSGDFSKGTSVLEEIL